MFLCKILLFKVTTYSGEGLLELSDDLDCNLRVTFGDLDLDFLTFFSTCDLWVTTDCSVIFAGDDTFFLTLFGFVCLTSLSELKNKR